MNRHLKLLSIPVAVALSISTFAFSACKGNIDENENVPEQINLEELFDCAKLFVASGNYSSEYKVTADFSGDLEKLNLMEDMEQGFWDGINRHEYESKLGMQCINTENGIYADYSTSMATYLTNTQGEQIVLADPDANASSRTLYLGQDCYVFDYSSGTFVKYGSRAVISDNDDDSSSEVAIPVVPYLLIQSLICQMLIIIDCNINGNIELSKQFMLDIYSVDITESEVTIQKSLAEVFIYYFGISPEEITESIKVKLTGSELTMTASATCNHAAKDEGDGNYNLYYEIEAKFNYAAGLTEKYFESLIN